MTNRERLGSSNFVAFLSTARPTEAREFYENVLGLRFVQEESRTLVFTGGGNYVRIEKVEQVPQPRGTALGWSVADIVVAAQRLEQRGVRLERFPGLSFDEHGVCSFPNGDRVAWFKDPDGNVLSLSGSLVNGQEAGGTILGTCPAWRAGVRGS